MAIQRLESQYYKMLNSILTIGAKKQLENSETLLKNYSPNNIRRVILGLDGIYVQFHVSNGVSKKEMFQEIKLVETLKDEICTVPSVYKAPLNILRGIGGSNRVYSSIEEIIILERNPNFPYPFIHTGLNWFLESEKVHTSFKRLRCVTVVKEPVTMEQFLDSIKEFKDDVLTPVTPKIPFQRVGKLIADKDYLLKTSLRPQYYELDSAGGRLDNHFNKVKELYYDSILDKAPSKETKNNLGGVISEFNNFIDTLYDLSGGDSSFISEKLVKVIRASKDRLFKAKTYEGWRFDVSVKRTNTDLDFLLLLSEIYRVNLDKAGIEVSQDIVRVVLSSVVDFIDMDIKLKRYKRFTNSVTKLKKRLHGGVTEEELEEFTDVIKNLTFHSSTESSEDSLENTISADIPTGNLADLIKDDADVVDIPTGDLRSELNQAEEVKEADDSEKILNDLFVLCLDNKINYINNLELNEQAEVDTTKDSEYLRELDLSDFATDKLGIELPIGLAFHRADSLGYPLKDALLCGVSEAYKNTSGVSPLDLLNSLKPNLDSWDKIKQGTVETGKISPSLEKAYRDIDELLNRSKTIYDYQVLPTRVIELIQANLTDTYFRTSFEMRCKKLGTRLSYSKSRGLTGTDQPINDLFKDLVKLFTRKVPEKRRDVGSIFMRAIKRAGGGFGE